MLKHKKVPYKSTVEEVSFVKKLHYGLSEHGDIRGITRPHPPPVLFSRLLFTAITLAVNNDKDRTPYLSL